MSTEKDLGIAIGRLEEIAKSIDRQSENLSLTNDGFHKLGTRIEIAVNDLDNFKSNCERNRDQCKADNAEEFIRVRGSIAHIKAAVIKTGAKIERTDKHVIGWYRKKVARKEMWEKVKSVLSSTGGVIAWVLAAIASIIAVLSSGCAGSPWKGYSAIAVQPQYTLNTKQKCIRQDETVRLTDQYLPIILDEMDKAGLIKYSDAINELAGKVLVCMVRDPEPCCMWKGNCAPPDKDGLFARKAGCTVWTSVWVSSTWPPVCTSEWPDEPHCDANEPYSMERTLAHELINMVGLNVAQIYKPDYQHLLFTKIELSIMTRIFGSN